ncbi:N-acetylglucosamine kinase [Lacinutrix iliipiscaria]|uniref:N-acetylglucosamine kinase n=1 Tax=Lacinutrix iliipiscaria TaxID=1230532 RepID=A0ABW5WR10_9FLAO
MILIADSGSTKCDWIALDQKGKQCFEKVRTKGLNPAILSEKKLTKIIKKSDVLMQSKKEVTHVFFYGAGCGTEKPRQLLKNILERIFKKAIVEVQEDTMAAVRASISTPNEAAIVCILGTGSNCSYYDGKHLHQRVDSLGYSIMDDASGNYFGKQLLRDYYFNHMPENLKASFASQFNVEPDYIKYNLYKQPNPNAYLAAFAEFMFLNNESEYISNLITSGITLFAKNMIYQFKDELANVPVHFAGSIAFFSQKEIRTVAKALGFKVGNFVRSPIEGLSKYHINNLN